MTLTRDLIGYADKPPTLRWPGGAGLAVNFVLNYEEGSEYAVGEGDGRSETALTEVSAARVPVGDRDLASESMYEYGSRVGFWRLHRLFTSRNVPLTVFAAAQALERNPPVATAIGAAGWDVVAHGWRWVEHYRLDEAAERQHIADAHASIARMVGKPPEGWYCRYAPSLNTRRLVAEHGGYSYDSDAYNDDVPYWTEAAGKPHLVVPYSLVTNDAKFFAGGLVSGGDFAASLIEAFEVLRAESKSMARMMSVGMHPRIIGQPGRVHALELFLDHIAGKSDVWICRRNDLAAHWRSQMPAPQRVSA